MICPNCGKDAGDAKFCPECGAPISTQPPQPPKEGAWSGVVPEEPKKKKKGGCLKIGLIVLAVFVVLGIIGGACGDTTTEGGEDTVPASASDGFMEGVEEGFQPESSQPEVAAATVGEENALKSAANYLAFTAFSYEGLIGQLEYEGFTHEEAVFAADNCGADWNEQALASAENYLSFSAFSYTGLINQLEYEQFTTEQATYAADNCGADWNEQAARSAETYMELMSFSREGLIDQLEYEGFTAEQAAYGADSVYGTSTENNPTSAQVTASVSPSQGEVWVAGSGSKYHNDPDCSNMKSPRAISLDEAIAMGLEPCKKCY